MKPFLRQDSFPENSQVHIPGHGHSHGKQNGLDFNHYARKEKRKFRRLFLGGTLLSFVVLSIMSTLILYFVGRSDVTLVLHTASNTAALEISERMRLNLERTTNFSRNLAQYISDSDLIRNFKNLSLPVQDSLIVSQTKFAANITGESSQLFNF